MFDDHVTASRPCLQSVRGIPYHTRSGVYGVVSGAWLCNDVVGKEVVWVTVCVKLSPIRTPEMCVGRDFLDLPHLPLLRFEDEFFVGSRETILQKIRQARPEHTRVVVEVTIRPGAAALVRAVTEPSLAVVVRARDRDLVFHSDAKGVVQLPVENRGSRSLTIRAGG